MKTKKVKKKIHKTSDPNYNVHTYSGMKNPFNIEYIKYYNPMEGRDQIVFLYIDKRDKKTVKYRILR